MNAAEVEAREVPNPSRAVVLHLHLFKNAGTSVEAILQHNFQAGWRSFDGDNPGGQLDINSVVDFLSSEPETIALSSHQLRPPLRSDASFQLLPILFLRHPLDRIWSAYRFERNQGGASPSSRAAAEHDIEGWIDFHDQRGSAQTANFQVASLSSLRKAGARLDRSVSIERHLGSAMGFVDNLAVVGLVERFDESWDRFGGWLRRWYPGFEGFSAHSNATSASSSVLDERIAALRGELGAKAFARLEQANAADLELFHRVMARY